MCCLGMTKSLSCHLRVTDHLMSNLSLVVIQLAVQGLNRFETHQIQIKLQSVICVWRILLASDNDETFKPE